MDQSDGTDPLWIAGKVMTDMNVAERQGRRRRVPVRIPGHHYDLRVPIMPDRLGERVNVEFSIRNNVCSAGSSRLNELQSTSIQSIWTKRGYVLVGGFTGTAKPT